MAAVVSEAEGPADGSQALVKKDGELVGLEPTLKNIQPIPIKKTLVIVNHFILNTTEFINKFVSLCEQKLCKVSKKIQRMEIVLQLLEGRLQSIEWLSTGAGSVVAVPANASQRNEVPAPGMLPPGGPPVAESSLTQHVPSLKEHPVYRKYIMLVMRGVPKQVISIKMQSEGLDPAVLDMDPDQPTPPHLATLPPDAVQSQTLTTALVVAEEGAGPSGAAAAGEDSEDSEASEGMDDD
eukprot:gb/GEZN01014965.1/.p1 GENE.gb/GEZN01014965.1/~~gb/GEZN01014965.1/.p1  ORF type:complete len:238 (-),score=44.50 gb/GEZN01014965.1/:150-863(-)